MMSSPPPPRRTITMRDVAVAAGVAQSTVSRALRNDPRIAQSQRERVKALATSMGYRPNPFVSAFTAQVLHYRRSPRGAIIAILECNPKGSRDFARAYREGAIARAQMLGFKAEIFQLYEINNSLVRLTRVLWTRSIVAVLVMPVQMGIDLSGFCFDNIAAATVDPALKKPLLHRAQPHYFQGIQLALTTLESRGYRRIAFCTTRNEVQSIGKEWLGGFMAWQALKPKGKRMDACIDIWDEAKFHKWLALHRPDAIVTNIPDFFWWARSGGWHPPEIAFATLADDEDVPEISGIHQNNHQVAAAAIDSIVAQINRNEYGLPSQPKTVLIQGRWHEGETVRKASALPTAYGGEADQSIDNVSL
jgi:LacI family transcriptional regulator